MEAVNSNNLRLFVSTAVDAKDDLEEVFGLNLDFKLAYCYVGHSQVIGGGSCRVHHQGSLPRPQR
jgi:hypothetical protein